METHLMENVTTVCTKCKECKPTTDFTWVVRHNRPNSWCRDCVKIARRTYADGRARPKKVPKSKKTFEIDSTELFNAQLIEAMENKGY